MSLFFQFSTFFWYYISFILLVSYKRIFYLFLFYKKRMITIFNQFLVLNINIK